MTSSFVAGAPAVFSASGALTTADKFAFLPESAVGCAGAAAAKVQMGAGNRVVAPTTLTVGKYKVCRAYASSGGSTDVSFQEQTMILDGVATVVSGLAAVNAVPTSIASESEVAMTVTGASTNDYVALIGTLAVGCAGASAAKKQVSGGRITTVSTMVAGTYQVCYAPHASGGSSDALFQTQAASVTVDSRKVTIRGTIVGTKLYARLGEGTVGSHISILDGAAVGCLGSVASTTKLELPAGGATITLAGEDAGLTFKLCAAPAAGSAPSSDAEYQVQGAANSISMAGAQARVDTLVEGLKQPTGIHVGRASEGLYVSDQEDGKVYQINLNTKEKTVIMSGLSKPHGITQNPDTGDLYVADMADGKLLRRTAGGTVTTVASSLPSPTGIEWSASKGVVYVTCSGDSGSGSVKIINPAGTVTAFAGGLTWPYGLSLDEVNGHVYVASAGTKEIIRFSTADTSGSASATVILGTGTQYPLDVAYDSSGTGGKVLIADMSASTVRQGTVAGTNVGSMLDYASGISMVRGVAIKTGVVSRVFAASGLFVSGTQVKPGIVTEIVLL